MLHHSMQPVVVHHYAATQQLSGIINFKHLLRQPNNALAWHTHMHTQHTHIHTHALSSLALGSFRFRPPM